MRPILFVAVALLVPVAAARAEDKPAAPPSHAPLSAEQQYLDRLLKMDDTAAAHVELAKWCVANKMDERAKVHWGEALARDPDNTEARAALGFVKRGTAWVPATEAAPDPIRPPTPAANADFLAQRQRFRKEIRDIAARLLRPYDAEKWAEGQRKILAIRDEAAAEPMARLLGVEGPAVRALAADALGQIPGDEALRYLLGFVLADPNEEVRKAAIESLKRQADDRVVQQLIYALARGRELTKQRAAHALGELGAQEAIPALIENLRSVHYETVQVKELRQPTGGMFSGEIVPYIVGLKPIVVGGAVAYDPIIGYIGVGSAIGSLQPREVTVEKTQKNIIEQPAVLAALVRITGRDFGYDPGAWRKWLAEYEKAEREKAKSGSGSTPAVKP